MLLSRVNLAIELISETININDMEDLALIELPILNCQIILNSENIFVGLFDEDVIIKEKGIDGLFALLDKFENKYVIDRLDSLFYENLIKFYPKSKITHLCPDCNNRNLVYGIPFDKKTIFCLHEFEKEIRRNAQKYFLRNL